MQPHSNETELAQLKQRLAELEARVDGAKKVRPARWPWVLAVVLAALGGTALGANGNCPNELPFCFNADSPALASQVNHNFMQLKEWLEAKVGPTSTANLTSANGTITTLSATSTSTSSLRLQGGPTSNVAAAAGVPLFASASILDGATNTGGFEFRHDNLSQGIGIGFNTLYATGSNPNQDVQLKPRGTGQVTVLGNLNTTGTLVAGGGSTVVVGVNAVGTATANCPAGKRIIFATGWTNDNNSACGTNDRQARCANPIIMPACSGTSSCSYTGNGAGCGNPGNTCIAITCL